MLTAQRRCPKQTQQERPLPAGVYGAWLTSSPVRQPWPRIRLYRHKVKPWWGQGLTSCAFGAPSRRWEASTRGVQIVLLSRKIRVRSEQPAVPLAPSPQADAESPPPAAEPVHPAPPDWATGILTRMGRVGGRNLGRREGLPQAEWVPWRTSPFRPLKQVRFAGQQPLGPHPGGQS